MLPSNLKALRIDPNNVNAHYNLAVLLLNDNQQAEIVHCGENSRSTIYRRERSTVRLNLNA